MQDNTSVKFLKHYRVLSILGRGHDSIVYRATSNDEDTLAIKVIGANCANQPEFVRSFEFKNDLIKRLDHPHIVPLIDTWRDPNGGYLVMPVYSRNLAAVVGVQPMHLDQVSKMITDICDALVEAHQIQALHGNLRPSNVFVDENGDYHISDFGFGTQVEYAEASPFRAPEQANDAVTTHQSDIYSLGWLVYYALTGRIALESPLLTIEGAGLTRVTALENVLRQATATDPTARYDNIETFADAFHRAVNQTIVDSVTLETTASATDDAAAVASSALKNFIQGSAGIRWRFERRNRNPYKGLRPFEEVDADDFFGRDDLTRDIINRLTEDHPLVRFLAVVGPSGSGKSSVVKAGVIAALRKGALSGSDTWLIAEMTPRSNPLVELHNALLRVASRPAEDILKTLQTETDGLITAVETALPSDGHLLLLVDQFEELFTLTSDAERAHHFLEVLMKSVSDSHNIHVIVTIRADFYDRPLLDPDFSRYISERTQLVLPMTSTEIEHTVVKPLDQLGVHVEPQLVTRIVDDVRGQLGVLPMLQYTLTELFDQSENNMLTPGRVRVHRWCNGVSNPTVRRRVY
jgi:serine/threonine protein kinase